MEATKIPCPTVPQTAVQSNEPTEGYPLSQGTGTSLIAALGDAILQQEQAVTKLLTEQTKLHSLLLECEGKLRTVKGEHRESVHEEKCEGKPLWTLESLAWELCPPSTPFLLTLKLIGVFNPVLFKHKKFT